MYDSKIGKSATVTGTCIRYKEKEIFPKKSKTFICFFMKNIKPIAKIAANVIGTAVSKCKT